MSDGRDAGTAPDDAARSLRSLKGPPVVGFRAPTPSAIGPMHTADTTTSLNTRVSQDDDEVLIDTADPSTYTVCETAAEIAAALTENR